MRELFYADAIKEALAQSMRRDDSVILFGEDIAGYGGVFGVTKGLFEEFGSSRVRNTPLAEGAIVGEAVGMAIYGLKPVPEIQFSDFVTTCMSPMVDLAATYHYRIGTPLPITFRMPSGGMMNIGNFHSKSLEAWFVHVPGLKLVMPSTAYDAKGLLLAAIRDPNPVLFLEHKKLYREIKDEVPEDMYEVPLGKCRVAREGSDLSIFTYGAMVHLALKAAIELEKEEISVEVVDLRTIYPFDEQGLAASFKKTKRAIILHEAPKIGGFGGELAAFLEENYFDYLAAPILRIGSKHTPIPTNPVLEKNYLPSEEDVVQAAKRLMTY